MPITAGTVILTLMSESGNLSDWQNEFIASIYGQSENMSIFKTFDKYLSKLATTGSISDRDPDATTSFVCHFLPAVVNTILGSSDVGYHYERVFAEILSSIASLIPRFIDNKSYWLFIVGSSSMFELKHAFYECTVPMHGGQSPYRTANGHAAATPELVAKLELIFESKDVSLEEFAVLIHMFGIIFGLIQPKEKHLVLANAFTCYTTILLKAGSEGINRIDDAILDKILYGFKMTILTSKEQAKTYVYVRLLTAVQLLQSENVNKQRFGLRIMEAVTSDRDSDLENVCEELVRMKFMNLIVTHEFHESIAEDVLNPVSYLLQYERVSEEEVRALWKVAVHQHSSVMKVYVNSIKLMTYSMSQMMVNALFDAIVEEKVFNPIVLEALNDKWSCFSDEQNDMLFDVLMKCYVESDDIDEMTNKAYVDALRELIPTSKEKQKEISRECVQMVIENKKCDFAVPMLQKMLIDLDQPELEELFDAFIASIQRDDKFNSTDSFTLLEDVLVNMRKSLAPDQFEKLYNLTMDVMEPSSEKFAAFYIKLYTRNSKLFTLDASFKIFTAICKLIQTNDSLIDLLKLTVRSMNVSGDMQSGVAVDRMWELLFDTGNESIAEFLLEIYANSRTQKAVGKYLEKCIDGLPCVGALVGISLFIFMTANDKPRSMNRYVCDDNEIRIRLCGYQKDTITVANDCSYDELVARISQVTGLYVDRIRCLDADKSPIKRSTFNPVDGMTVDVRMGSAITRNYVVARDRLSLDFIEREYEVKLFNVMMSDDEDLAFRAFRIMNRLPTCPSAIETLKKYSWDEVFDAKHLYVFLYYVHAIGNMLIESEPEWTDGFYGTGGATRFLEVFLENMERLGEHMLTVMNVAIAVTSGSAWESCKGKELDSSKLLDVIRAHTDSNMVSKSLLFVSKLGLECDSGVVELCRKNIFSSNADLRKQVYDMIDGVEDHTRMDLLINMLDQSMAEESFSGDYYQLLNNSLQNTTEAKRLLEAITDCIFRNYQMPDDLIERFVFKVPSQEAHKSIFSIMNQLMMKVGVVENGPEIFWFIVKQIIYNGVRYYEITQDIYDILILLAKQNPSVVEQFIPVIMEHEGVFNCQCENIRMTQNQPHKGIGNMGCTCYMNATIQQFFAVQPFRDAVLNGQSDKEWFSELQYAFGKLVGFPSSYVSIANFVRKWKGWDGAPVDVRQQQDAGEFLQMMLERIDEILPETANLFKGKIRHVLTTPANATVSIETYEEFITLPLDINGMHGVNESFRLFLTPDHFDSYSLDDIGKVEAFRDTMISESPEILVVQLKRFMYNLHTAVREKINDRFVFPVELDLAPIKVDRQIPDMYDLCGVVMHSGMAQSGHYFSHVKTNDGWFTFNDTSVTKCDIDSILETGYGGGVVKPEGMLGQSYENTKSAYLLFYKKRCSEQSNQEPNGNVLPESVMKRLVSDVNQVVLRRIVSSDEYGKFIAELCVDSPEILFEHIYNVMMTNGSADMLVEKLFASLEAHPECANTILVDLKKTNHILLSNKDVSIRSLYLSIIEKCIAYGTQESVQVLIDNICEKTRGEDVMTFWRSFNEFFVPVLIALRNGFDKTLIDASVFVTFLTTTVKSYDALYSSENVYQTINLVTVMEILIALDANSCNEFRDAAFIEKMRLNPLHAAVFMNFSSSLVNPESMDATIKQLSSGNVDIPLMVFNFILLLRMDESSSAKFFKRFVKIILRSGESVGAFWTQVMASIPDSMPGIARSFIPNSQQYFEEFMLSEFYAVRISFMKFVVKVFAADTSLGPDECGCLYRNMLNVTVSLISFVHRVSDHLYGKNITYYKNWDITLPYFDLMTALVVRGNLQSKVIGSSDIFCSLMERFGLLGVWEAPRNNLFGFILNTVDSQCYDLFFSTGSFVNFIKGFTNFALDRDGIDLMKRLFAIIPENCSDRFFKSDLFNKLVSQVFGREQCFALFGLELCEFVRSRLAATNVKSVCAKIWSEAKFDKCMSHHMKLTCKILKEFPDMVSFFEHEDYHLSICEKIVRMAAVGERCSIYALKFYAKLLAVFNERFIELNAGKRNIFIGSYIERLANKYCDMGLQIDHIFFLAGQHFPGAPKNSICRLLLSFVRMSAKLCAHVFALLCSCQSAMFNTQSPIKQYLPAFVVAVCRQQIQFTDGDSAMIAQSVDLMTRELYAVLHSSDVIDPIALDALGSELSKWPERFPSGVSTSIGLMYERESDPKLFTGGAFALAKACATSESATKWVSDAARVMARCIRQGLDDETLLEQTGNAINYCHDFIDYFAKKFDLQVPAISSDEDKFALANKLEALMRDQMSQAAVILVQLLS